MYTNPSTNHRKPFVLVAGTEIEQFLFDSRNWRQKKIGTRCMPDGTTHTPDSGVDFMAAISGAGFWSLCRWLKAGHLQIRAFTYTW